MNNGWFYDNAYMDEDQNCDLSNGQFSHSVGISQFVVVVKDGQSLEQLKLNFHEEQVNCHERIQQSETEWALSSLEYERTSPSHIQDRFCACCGQFVPKV